MPATSDTAQLPAQPLPSVRKAPVPLSPAPVPFDELLSAACQARDREDFTRAESLYGQILQQNPRHLEALIGMGLIQANRGRYADARQFAARAIRQDDLCPHPYLLRGLILEMEGETERAAVEFQKVLWLEMEAVVARYHLARIHGRNGRSRDAGRELRTVIRYLERLPAETVVPFSGGLSREVFLEVCREDLGEYSQITPAPNAL